MKIQDSNPANSLPLSPVKLVRLWPSRYYCYGGLALHGIAALAVLVCSLSWWFKAIILLYVAVNLWLFIRNWQRQAVMRVQYQQGQWQLFDISLAGEQVPRYTLLRWHFWSLWLLVVVAKDQRGAVHYLPLFCDSCSAEEFRWLRVLVKFYL